MKGRRLFHVGGILLLLLSASFGWGQVQKGSLQYQYSFELPTAEEVNADFDVRHFAAFEERIMRNYRNTYRFSNQNNFIIQPKIHVLGEYEAGEMQSFKVYKLELELVVSDLEKRNIFHEKSFVISDKGKDLNAVIASASKKFNQNKQVIKFFEEANMAIETFYGKNCNLLVASAKVKLQREQFELALIDLQYVPENSTCFAEVEQMITNILVGPEGRNKMCKNFLKQAYAEESLRNYSEALGFLLLVDVNATCFEDAVNLMTKISSRLNEEELREFEMRKKEFDGKTEIEKLKIVRESLARVDLTL